MPLLLSSHASLVFTITVTTTIIIVIIVIIIVIKLLVLVCLVCIRCQTESRRPGQSPRLSGESRGPKGDGGRRVAPPAGRQGPEAMEAI